MWFEKFSLSSFTTPRFLAVFEGVMFDEPVYVMYVSPLLLLLFIYMFINYFLYRTTYLALPTSSALIPVTPEQQNKGIMKTGCNLKMSESERCRAHPRSDGFNIICAAFDFSLLTILWVRLSSLCLFSTLTGIYNCAQFPAAPVFIIPYQSCVIAILYMSFTRFIFALVN